MNRRANDPSFSFRVELKTTVIPVLEEVTYDELDLNETEESEIPIALIIVISIVAVIILVAAFILVRYARKRAKEKGLRDLEK